MSDDMLVRHLLFGSSEEGVHFQRVMRAAREGSTRDALARYAGYLTGLGDARGEWLTLACELEAPRTTRDAREDERRRLAELETQIPGQWRAMLLDVSKSFNCGDAPGDDPVVRFAYECPRKWESLTPTDAPEVRHCDSCRQVVTLCTTRDRAEAMARDGACIAIPSVLAGGIFRDVTQHMTGRPDPAASWARRLLAATPGDAGRGRQ